MTFCHLEFSGLQFTEGVDCLHSVRHSSRVPRSALEALCDEFNNSWEENLEFNIVGEIFISLQLTEGIRLFFQGSLNNLFTNVVSIDFIYMYCEEKIVVI